MSKQTIRMALAPTSAELADALEAWLAERGYGRDDATEIERGPGSGTVRILVAAVQRLADENAALAAALTEVTQARLEIVDPDGRVTEVSFGVEDEDDEEAAELVDALRAEALAAVEGHRARLGDPAAWANPDAFAWYQAEATSRVAGLRAEQNAQTARQWYGWPSGKSGILLETDISLSPNLFRFDDLELKGIDIGKAPRDQGDGPGGFDPATDAAADFYTPGDLEG